MALAVKKIAKLMAMKSAISKGDFSKVPQHIIDSATADVKKKQEKEKKKKICICLGVNWIATEAKRKQGSPQSKKTDSITRGISL